MPRKVVVEAVDTAELDKQSRPVGLFALHYSRHLVETYREGVVGEKART